MYFCPLQVTVNYMVFHKSFYPSEQKVSSKTEQKNEWIN